MKKYILESIIMVCVPVAGAMGYVHGTFATISQVERNNIKIERVDKLICKMAIRQGIEDAESICTAK